MSEKLTVFGKGCLPYASTVAMPGDWRAIVIDCTSAGTVMLTFPDTSVMTLHLQQAIYTFNFNILTFTLGSAAATAYAVL